MDRPFLHSRRPDPGHVHFLAFLNLGRYSPTLKPGVSAGTDCSSQLLDYMYWTLELASYLEDAPWPATKDELIDYAERTGAPLEVIENLEAMEDDGEPYESIEELWPDFPTADDDFYFEEE